MDTDAIDRSQRGVCISRAIVKSHGFWLGFSAIAGLLVLALFVLQILDSTVKARSQVAWSRNEVIRELELNLTDFQYAVQTHTQVGGMEFQLVAANAAAGLEKYLEEYNRQAGTEKQRQLAAKFHTLWTELKGQSRLLLNNQIPPPNPLDLDKFESLRLDLKNFLVYQVQADSTAERKALDQSILPYIRTALVFALFALILFAGLIFSMSLVSSNVLEAANQIPIGIKRHRIQDRYRAIAESLPQIVWTSRPDGIFTFCNQNWFSFTGLTVDESRGIGWTMAIDPNFRQEALKTWEDVRAKGAEFDMEIPIRRADGVVRWHLVRGVPLQDEVGKIIKWLGVITDIHDHRQASQIEVYRHQLDEVNNRLEKLATTDSLTRLKNRRIFQETLDEEIQWAVRYSTQLSLLLLDVDHLKQFNESFGQSAGDDVLREVSRLLKKTARTTDFVARYGGGSFALLLPGTDQQGAMIFAEKIRKAVELANWPQREITVTIGVAALDADNCDGNTLVEEAEVSLYLGKRSGRNCVYIASGNGTQDYFRQSTSWPKPPHYGGN